MDLSRHPMRAQTRPHVITQPFNRGARALSVVLEFGRPSLRVRGPGRGGKTTWYEMLRRLRDWRPFPLGFLYTIAGKPDRPTEASLFRSLAFGMKLKGNKTSSAEDALGRIANAIEEEAARSGASIVVFAIDNAENLTLVDYGFLVRLQTMFCGDLKLFILFILQSDATPEGCDALEAIAPPHIRGRFFLDKHFHTGLLWSIPEDEREELDACDVALALRAYDQMRWPDPKGPTFLEAFAPKAYARGWRLEQQTDDIRAGVERVCAANNLEVMLDWLMVSFEPFVYCCMVRIAGQNPDFERLTPDDIDLALTASAFVASEKARQGITS
jgi:hypothetical protein